ncbi:MAG TPA: aminopeptidase P N-terminal domain-containing protein [Methylomirabilota bacterium]|nr:aminopeptidase P N-terminal domain-containing protein [Methylomirabilota bacterium]
MDFNGQIYAARREAFVKQMGEGVAIFPAAPESIRSNDTGYRYRQDSDFYYLTGFPEPEALCVLSPQHEKERFILFVRPRDKEKETWTGRRFGAEGAKDIFGADAAYTIDKIDEVLSQHLALTEKVYYALGRDERMNAKILDLMNRARLMRPRTGKGPTSMIDPGEILHEMRLFKSEGELGLMQRAVTASTAAHHAALMQARPGMYEYEIEALLEFQFRRHGAAGPAYPSIVASGANATILHYIENNCQLRDGDLLLIDAAAEYGCYCSDVTRTFPVGARFSPLQREIYALVLTAQKEAIAMIRPGVKFDEVHLRATEILVDGLKGFGLLSGETKEIIEKGEQKKFYMHRTSHWLGMDVHDVGKYKIGDESRVLAPGMVLTVEPGVYIAEDAEGVEERFRGIGIRIEDDVLVTADGHEVLTKAIPKEIDEIETIRKGA